MTLPRPTALTIQWDRIPQELIRLPQWVCWRYELDGDHWTKRPKQPNGRSASSADPTTWADLASVRRAYEEGRYTLDGVGCVFSGSDGNAGVDLDGCRDEAGNISPEAQAIIDRLNSYTEVSPSGTGVKVWVQGRLPEGARNVSNTVKGFKKFEAYHVGRYFAATGRHLPGTPKTIEPRQEELLAVHAEIFPEEDREHPPPPPREPVVQPAGVGFQGTDEELLTAIRRSRGGAKFSALFDRGDVAGYGEDHSDADMALCGTHGAQKVTTGGLNGATPGMDRGRGREAGLAVKSQRGKTWHVRAPLAGHAEKQGI